MTTASQSVDHLVIGGGPAGSMLASRLAASGRHVTLIEREREPHHKVCGEFLSREAIDYLHQADIDPLDFGAAAIHRVRLSSGSAIAEASLPFPALSLSRCTLDEALLARVKENGCRLIRGLAVESLALLGTDWQASLSNGQCIRSGTVFLATGKHNLRSFTRTPARQTDLIGFKMHWRLAPTQIAAPHGYMDLYLFPGGYGGLSLIEDDIANLCFVVRRSTLRRLGVWPELFTAILQGNRHLQKLLEGAEPLWPRPLAISPIPYGYLTPEERNLWCLGDQAAVIPSFTGDGISIALHSAALAAQMFLSGSNASDYHLALRTQLQRSMALATRLSQLAVTRIGRVAARVALPLFPEQMQWIASSTRIPQSSLVLGEHNIALPDCRRLQQP